jgi:hypothetical protein
MLDKNVKNCISDINSARKRFPLLRILTVSPQLLLLFADGGANLDYNGDDLVLHLGMEFVRNCYQDHADYLIQMHHSF